MTRTQAIHHLTDLARLAAAELCTGDDERAACTRDTYAALRALGVGDEEMA